MTTILILLAIAVATNAGAAIAMVWADNARRRAIARERDLIIAVWEHRYAEAASDWEEGDEVEVTLVSPPADGRKNYGPS